MSEFTSARDSAFQCSRIGGKKADASVRWAVLQDPDGGIAIPVAVGIPNLDCDHRAECGIDKVERSLWAEFCPFLAKAKPRPSKPSR